MAVLEPLVELAFCGDDDLGQNDEWDRGGTGGQIRRLVNAWLRGLIAARSGPDALRQQVRDRILAPSPEPHDEFAVTALATLGPDLDDRAEAFLRAVPAELLEPAVELAGPTIALTAHQPGLLLELAESYYLMDPVGTPPACSGSVAASGRTAERPGKAGSLVVRPVLPASVGAAG